MMRMASLVISFIFFILKIKIGIIQFWSFASFFKNLYIVCNIVLTLNAKYTVEFVFGKTLLCVPLLPWHCQHCWCFDIVACMTLLFTFSKLFLWLLMEDFNEFIYPCQEKKRICNDCGDLADEVYFNHLKCSFTGFSVFEWRFEWF